MMNPNVPGVTWSSERPGRSEGDGEGTGVVARTRSKCCTVYLLWNRVCPALGTSAGFFRRWPDFAALPLFYGA
jgi:hypothetical protein